MPEIKPLSHDAIPQALEKAKHYRLLNQPWQAESICRDILRTDPDHQGAIYTLVLAMTDQFERTYKSSVKKAHEMVERLTEAYEQEYCMGLICERQAKAALKRSTPRAGYIAFEFLDKAMEHFEKAEEIRPPDNELSILRWNSCVRFIEQHKLEAAPDDQRVQPFLDA